MADNLLDKASILLTPTAYDNGSMLSIKPENGDGDFDFQRSGNASRFDSSGNIVTESANIPRIDYTDGCGSWLLEPQSTNLVTYSEDFSQSVWAKGRVSITPNSVKSPDGSINASTLFVTSATGGEEYLRVQSNNANEATCSFYVKKGNWRYITIRSVNASVFDFDTETFTFTGTNEIVSFEKLQNGWYRLKASSPTRIYCSIGFAISASTPSAGSSVNGTNMYIWGAQLENQSFASSYIPTSGTTVTRVGETCVNATPEINSEEGVLYAEISALADDGTARNLGISDGTTNNRILILYSTNSNQLRFYLAGSGGSITINHTLTDATEFIKVAVKYKAQDFSFYVNGVEVNTNASNITFSGLDELSFNNPFGGGTSPFYGNTKDIQVFTEALSDYQLEQLTSWSSFSEMAKALNYTIQ